MNTATLNLTVTPKRMLTKKEAAHHCGRPVKAFANECPVQPVQFRNGDKRYDVHDLDNWLDSLKPEGQHTETDKIVGLLDS